MFPSSQRHPACSTFYIVGTGVICRVIITASANLRYEHCGAIAARVVFGQQCAGYGGVLAVGALRSAGLGNAATVAQVDRWQIPVCSFCRRLPPVELTPSAIQSCGERDIEKSQIVDATLVPTLALALTYFDPNQAQFAKSEVRVLRAVLTFVAWGMRMQTMRAIAAVLCLCVRVSADAAGDDKKTTTGPATVENRVKESDLTVIKLTPEAERRLGITLVAAERKSISLPRRLPGELLVPPGRTIVISAPVAGLVTLPSPSESMPSSGQRVQRGNPLFRLQPGESRDGKTFVAADRISLARANADLTAARIEAEGQLEQARVRVEAADVKLKRADQLRQEGAGAQRNHDEARAELDLATSQRNAAQDRVRTLSQVLTSLESGEQATVTIEAPLDGYVRAVHAAPGQIVASGAPLLEVVAMNPLWVRVPVYVGDLSAIRASGNVRVRGLTEGPQSPSHEGRRVHAPEPADPRAATVDLQFELDNPNGEWRPGQRVAVELQTDASGEALVVPYAAILFDIYGGTWVYENTGPQVYSRRRVEIRAVSGDAAALARGLAPGARVVTAGAAELFGTEFGVGK